MEAYKPYNPNNFPIYIYIKLNPESEDSQD